MRTLLGALLAGALLAGAASAAREPQLRDGDLLFQRPSSSFGDAIQRATESPYTHVGIVLFRDGRPYVFEAAGDVHYTPLAAWAAQGPLIAKRLNDADTRLTPGAIRELHRQAERLEGRPYDSLFGWSDDHLYCSELVWKLYDRAVGVRLGTPRPLRTFRLDDPVVAAEVKARFGDHPPLDEPAISPGQVFEAEALVALTGS